jgi:hypothetical protein
MLAAVALHVQRATAASSKMPTRRRNRKEKE